MIGYEKFNTPSRLCPGWETIPEGPDESQSSYHSAIADIDSGQSEHGLIHCQLDNRLGQTRNAFFPSDHLPISACDPNQV